MEQHLPVVPNPSFGVAAASARERRASPRKPLRTQAVVNVAGQQLSARTIDMSREGLSITLDRNLAPGTLCNVAFSLLVDGHSVALNLQGRVAHGVLTGQQGFKVGLVLSRMPAQDQDAIDRYLRS